MQTLEAGDSQLAPSAPANTCASGSLTSSDRFRHPSSSDRSSATTGRGAGVAVYSRRRTHAMIQAKSTRRPNRVDGDGSGTSTPCSDIALICPERSDNSLSRMERTHHTPIRSPRRRRGSRCSPNSDEIDTA